MKLKNLFVFIIIISLSFVGCKQLSFAEGEKVGSKVYIKMNNTTTKDVTVVFDGQTVGHTTFGGIINANTIKDFEIDFDKIQEDIVDTGLGIVGGGGNLYAYIDNEKKSLSAFRIYDKGDYRMEYPKIEGVIKGGATTEGAIYVEWSRK